MNRRAFARSIRQSLPLLVLIACGFCEKAHGGDFYVPWDDPRNYGGASFLYADVAGNRYQNTIPGPYLYTNPSVTQSFSGPGNDNSTFSLNASVFLDSLQSSVTLNNSLSVSGSTPGYFETLNSTDSAGAAWQYVYVPIGNPPLFYLNQVVSTFVGSVAPGDSVEIEIDANWDEGFAYHFDTTIDTPGPFSVPINYAHLYEYFTEDDELGHIPATTYASVFFLITKGGSGTTWVKDVGDLSAGTSVPEPAGITLLLGLCGMGLAGKACRRFRAA